VRRTKYLVEGEIVLLKELGGPDDYIFGGIGYLVVKRSGCPSMHERDNRATYRQHRRLSQ